MTEESLPESPFEAEAIPCETVLESVISRIVDCIEGRTFASLGANEVAASGAGEVFGRSRCSGLKQ